MSGMSISGRRSSRSAPTSRTRSRCGSTVMSGQSARPARPGSGSARARAVNRRLLDTERVGQGCVLASPAFERIARPTLTEDGRKTPALRFGDLRVQALAGALCTTMLAVTGITNKSLRALMTGLLDGIDYTTNQASYDLARLRLNALITRLPGTNRYRLTTDGLRF